MAGGKFDFGKPRKINVLSQKDFFQKFNAFIRSNVKYWTSCGIFIASVIFFNVMLVLNQNRL